MAIDHSCKVLGKLGHIVFQGDALISIHMNRQINITEWAQENSCYIYIIDIAPYYFQRRRSSGSIEISYPIIHWVITESHHWMAESMNEFLKFHWFVLTSRFLQIDSHLLHGGRHNLCLWNMHLIAIFHSHFKKICNFDIIWNPAFWPECQYCINEGLDGV